MTQVCRAVEQTRNCHVYIYIYSLAERIIIQLFLGTSNQSEHRKVVPPQSNRTQLLRGSPRSSLKVAHTLVYSSRYIRRGATQTHHKQAMRQHEPTASVELTHRPMTPAHFHLGMYVCGGHINVHGRTSLNSNIC